MTKQFTSENIDHLLRLVDDHYYDFGHHVGEDDPVYKKAKSDWDALRPMLAAAPRMLAALERTTGMIDNLLSYGDVNIAAEEKLEDLDLEICTVIDEARGMDVDAEIGAEPRPGGLIQRVLKNIALFKRLAMP